MLAMITNQKGASRVPSWGRTISRTSSQNGMLRNGRAVCCASDSHYDHAIALRSTVRLQPTAQRRGQLRSMLIYGARTRQIVGTKQRIRRNLLLEQPWVRPASAPVQTS
jgi:hypothetical protein